MKSENGGKEEMDSLRHIAKDSDDNVQETKEAKKGGKSESVFLFLAGFFAPFGAQYFYIGYIKLGFLVLLNTALIEFLARGFALESPFQHCIDCIVDLQMSSQATIYLRLFGLSYLSNAALLLNSYFKAYEYFTLKVLVEQIQLYQF